MTRQAVGEISMPIPARGFSRGRRDEAPAPLTEVGPVRFWMVKKKQNMVGTELENMSQLTKS
jgi:hypothetical protein